MVKTSIDLKSGKECVWAGVADGWDGTRGVVGVGVLGRGVVQRKKDWTGCAMDRCARGI